MQTVSVHSSDTEKTYASSSREGINSTRSTGSSTEEGVMFVNSKFKSDTEQMHMCSTGMNSTRSSSSEDREMYANSMCSRRAFTRLQNSLQGGARVDW